MTPAIINPVLKLNQDTMAELREIVQKLHANGGPVPFQELIALGSQPELRDKGVTVDLESSETLGSPLVVLHNLPTASPIQGLSPRESEVASLIAEGLSNKEIAERLFLSVGTVKDHVHNILKATGLPNRAAVAGKARRA
jgi:DNA-binding NarL/FixJ family response regulator